MNISFFKESTNNGGKFISHGRMMIAEFLRCPCTYTANLITGCYEQMKFSSKELVASSVVCWEAAKEECVCTLSIYIYIYEQKLKINVHHKLLRGFLATIGFAKAALLVRASCCCCCCCWVIRLSCSTSERAMKLIKRFSDEQNKWAVFLPLRHVT